MNRNSDTVLGMRRELYCPRSVVVLLVFLLTVGGEWCRTASAQDPMDLGAMHLAAGDEGRRIYLRTSGTGDLQFARQAGGVDSAWIVAPVGQDMVRLQQTQGNRWYALGVDPVGLGNPGPNGPNVRFAPMGNTPNQLWRIQQFQGGGYLFENVAVAGLWLTCAPNGGLWLQPFANTPWQVWWPQQPTFALPAPQYRTISEQMVPNPALAAASLRINNTHNETILILLADRRQPGHLTKLRIAPEGTETITLDRDAGGTVVQTIEVTDGFGNWDRQEIEIPIPPKILYDMSVYEEFLQSIAIDRTGKSPNVIEDINYQPRSVGFFLLPAGDGLPDSGAMDAYGAAVEANNPGAVRPMSKKDRPGTSSQTPPRDPLRDILDQIQNRRGKF
jgi:hypothetical protein